MTGFEIGCAAKPPKPHACCAGSYIQCVADYHNLIYYKDPSALYVNLYLPSEVRWQRPEGEVQLVQETSYPEKDTTTLRLQMKQPSQFALKFRVPGWTKNASVKVNGAEVNVPCTPGTWAAISRTWAPGDTAKCRLCPQCTAHDDGCLIVVMKHVDRADAPLLDLNRPGFSSRTSTKGEEQP